MTFVYFCKRVLISMTMLIPHVKPGHFRRKKDHTNNSMSVYFSVATSPGVKAPRVGSTITITKNPAGKGTVVIKKVGEAHPDDVKPKGIRRDSQIVILLYKSGPMI